MSALPPKADQHVRFAPKVDIDRRLPNVRSVQKADTEGFVFSQSLAKRLISALL